MRTRPLRGRAAATRLQWGWLLTGSPPRRGGGRASPPCQPFPLLPVAPFYRPREHAGAVLHLRRCFPAHPLQSSYPCSARAPVALCAATTGGGGATRHHRCGAGGVAADPPPRARTPLGADVYQARQPPERPSGQMAPAVTSGGTPKAPTPRAVAKAAVAQRVRGGFHCHGTLASRSSPPRCHGRVPLLDSHRQSTHKQRWVPTTAGTTAFVHSGCLPGSQTPPGKAHSPTAPPARGTDQASGGQW